MILLVLGSLRGGAGCSRVPKRGSEVLFLFPMYFLSLVMASRIQLKSSGLKDLRGVSMSRVTEPWGPGCDLEVVVHGR